jgi:hypothetical protein
MSEGSPRLGSALGPLAALVLAAGLGCDGGDPAGPGGSSKRASGKQELESNGGNYLIQFETAPDPIPLNEPFILKFAIIPRKPAGTGPAPGEIGVEVDARMPAHFHGMGRVPKLIRRPDGTFLAEGMLFHMPGRWELYFDISQGPRTERAQWNVDLQ